MTTYTSARLSLQGEEPQPDCRIVDVDGKPRPIIEWRGPDFTISLGMLDDPGKYLHDLAVRLLALADEVDAARPVPYVVAETPC